MWLAAIALLGAPAPAHEAGTRIIGIGVSSCATAFRPENEGHTMAWIGGFWSGMNAANEDTVGGNTDVDGVVAEVRKDCDLDPSVALAVASFVAYRRLKRIGR